MTTPAETEATNQQWIVATYQDADYTLPADTDDWPLLLIAASVGVNADGVLIPDHTAITRALHLLLGEQWNDFMLNHPLRRDLVPASQTFAAAAGFTGGPQDNAFGALPRLLSILDTHPEAVEATLGSMGLDYGDRWRPAPLTGRHLLPLRKIHVALNYAPPTSPLAIALNDGKMPFTATDVLLMDVYEAITKTVHPSRPLTAAQKAERTAAKTQLEKATEDYRRRHPTGKTRRQDAVAVARANAQPVREAINQ